MSPPSSSSSRHSHSQPSYYDTLHLPCTATQEQVNKAYRSRALANHPDRGGKEEDFKLVAEAYETLSDPERRSRYDRRLNGTYEPSRAAAGGSSGGDRYTAQGFRDRRRGPVDPFDLFDDLFPDFFPSRRRGAAGQGGRGRRGDPFADLMGGSAFPFGGSGLGGGGGATAAAGSFFDDDFFSSTLEPFPSHRGGLARESLAQPRSNFRTGSSYSSSSFSTTSSTAGASRHTSQQRSTRIVNGVREEVTETRDARGNVTVHMTRGDGSQSVHVNGVEQASHPLLEGERTRRGSQRDGDRDVGSAGRPITVD